MPHNIAFSPPFSWNFVVILFIYVPTFDVYYECTPVIVKLFFLFLFFVIVFAI